MRRELWWVAVFGLVLYALGAVWVMGEMGAQGSGVYEHRGRVR